jgi:SAM-dependent methyltransferase
MIIFLTIISIIFLILAIFYFVFMIDILIFAHNLPTSKKAILEVIKIIKKYNPKALNFYDLGCGHGKVVLEIKKEMPNLNVYGVDKDGIRIFFAKIKALILKRKINFINENIFNIDLSKADVLYTYLWYDLMPILEEKVKKELKKGSIIITNTSHFSNLKPIETVRVHPKIKDENFEKLFVYKIN